MTDSFQHLNASHLTIEWFHEQNELGKIRLRPPFQRRPVWTDSEKAFLVDTILRKYPVPELYYYATTDSETEKSQYAIVDGQQRLRACLEFMREGFAINFDVNKLAPLYSLEDTPWFGKKWSQLTREERERFRKYKLVVRDLEGVSDEQIKHMFQRLNQANIVLNNQELRYAMYQGGMLKVVEKLVERDEWKHFRIFTKLQYRRMLDSEFIGELVVGYLHWPQNKKDDLDHYYRQYSNEFPFTDEILERFDEVLRYLVAVFPSPHMGGTRWYRKSDFYTLFLAYARGRLPVDFSQADLARKKLVDFSRAVSAADDSDDDESSVVVYRRAVQRAATDRTRRVRREDALVSFVTGQPMAQDDEEIEEVEEEENTPDDELDEEYENVDDVRHEPAVFGE